MRTIIGDSYKLCKEVLETHKNELELLAQTLMVKETLDTEEIRQLIENGKLDDEEINSKVKVQIQGKENRSDQKLNLSDEKTVDSKIEE